jgi:transcription elongation factor GreB
MKYNLLTKKGFNKLKAEFDNLSLIERPKVVAGVTAAALEGDRSENAEYIYGKKRLREIDKRLSYLAKFLKYPRIIDSSMVNTQTVNFGCKVLVKTAENEEKVFTLVGEGEADYKEKTISFNAPVAKALLQKKLGDIVEVELVKGIIELEIINISLGDID